MTTPVSVTQKGVTVKHLRDKLARKQIHAVPVVEDDGTIAGIVSSSDLSSEHNEETIVDKIMTTKVHIVMPNNRVEDAAKVMVKHHVHHLVVMEEGNIVGIVSSLDLLKALVDA